MTWNETFERIAAHYAAMAMMPGCWAAAQHQVAAMEQERGSHWTGLRAAVGRRIKAAAFRPHPSEIGEWWSLPSKLPVSRHGRGS